MATTFTVNGKPVEVDAPTDTPYWVLRDHLKLTGTKYSCGIGTCGTCTVHVDGNATRACILPLAAVSGKSITTIEGLSSNNSHPLQKAWISEQVPQCGFCQPGQIMQAAALLDKEKSPTREKIVQHMNGNLCRCGAYRKILQAIEKAAADKNKTSNTKGG